ncbi:hypothetical protein NIES4074_61510 (plasmid) [Cylindrospermum sp. NIES-4074]|nr:hypothetical protein NIES4074_61510 [Cylindrospermum sp. NIES-4074]
MKEILTSLQSLEPGQKTAVIKEVIKNLNAQERAELASFLDEFNQSSIAVSNPEFGSKQNTGDSTVNPPEAIKNETSVNGSFVSINTGIAINIQNSTQVVIGQNNNNAQNVFQFNLHSNEPAFVEVPKPLDENYRIFILLIAIIRTIKP